MSMFSKIGSFFSIRDDEDDSYEEEADGRVVRFHRPAAVAARKSACTRRALFRTSWKWRTRCATGKS